MNTGAEGGNFIKKTAKAHKKKEPGQNTKSLTPFSAYGDLEWTKGRRCDKIHEAKDRKEHTRMDNVIFIGMPAVGKSTVGVVVAKRLGYRFLDVDILIQETEGKLLREIIRENGIGGFLGYPLEDVVGFIRHRGKCFTCCGCWKIRWCV